MRRRRRTALAVIGIVANLVGIAALACPQISFPQPTLTALGDATTTWMWVEGYETTWVLWAGVTLAVAGLATVVAALRSTDDGVAG